MKAKLSLYAATGVVLLSLALLTGCSRNPFATASDAQIASDVQAKLNSDPNLSGKQISASSSNGVVTLNGNVDNDLQRQAAVNDAGQVSGVKTVLSNLEMQSAQAAPAPAYSEPTGSERRYASRRTSTRSERTSYEEPPADTTTAVAPASTMAAAPAPAPVRPITIPDGTTLSIRMIDGIDSQKNQPGDTFRATLDSPLMSGDQVVIPSGADVQGRVVEDKSAGHFTGSSQIALELTKLMVNGREYPLHTNQYTRQGASRGKNTAAKVGGGAAVGAVIGAIAGGGKGAAIGSVIGAGAGTGVQAATHGQQIRIDPESLLSFQLQSPVTVTPVASLNRDANRQHLDFSDQQP